MTKNQRINKGNSLLVFPTSFSIIDIETTGLSPRYDEIIELPLRTPRQQSQKPVALLFHQLHVSGSG